MTDAFPALTEGPRARRPPATHSWGRRAR
jgi:hypothetical protein